LGSGASVAAQKPAVSYETTTLLQKAVIGSFTSWSGAEQARLDKILYDNTPAGAIISPNEVTASLSGKFFDTAVMVVLFAILLTTAVVFVIFRSVAPSIAVLTGAAADVIMAMGAMSLFGIPLTLASFSALLMLVGFSLDTDVLLTMRVLKRSEGTAAELADLLPQSTAIRYFVYSGVLLEVVARFSFTEKTKDRIRAEYSLAIHDLNRNLEQVTLTSARLVAPETLPTVPLPSAGALLAGALGLLALRRGAGRRARG
jgi:preprotein translocase subunit SecF